MEFVCLFMEKFVERDLGKETEVLGGDLPHCRIVHLKSLMTWLGFERVTPWLASA
jgi:hypothetical protein